MVQRGGKSQFAVRRWWMNGRCALCDTKREVSTLLLNGRRLKLRVHSAAASAFHLVPASQLRSAKRDVKFIGKVTRVVGGV